MGIARQSFELDVLLMIGRRVPGQRTESAHAVLRLEAAQHPALSAGFERRERNNLLDVRHGSVSVEARFVCPCAGGVPAWWEESEVQRLRLPGAFAKIKRRQATDGGLGWRARSPQHRRHALIASKASGALVSIPPFQGGCVPKAPALVLTVAILVLAQRPTSAGDAGHAIQLDGISGYLGCDLPGSIRSGELTLSAWINRAGPRGDLISPEPRGQAAVGLGFHFGLSAGKIYCAKGNGSGTYVVLIGNTSVPVSSWHHVAATLDNGALRVYLDGLLDGELDDASMVDWADLPEIFPPGQVNYPSPAQLYLGADKHNQLGLGPTIPDFDFYEGTLDEAQVWSRALTQAEIAFYRRISLTGLEPGLIHYWKFDEGAGTVAFDEATHQADLTLYPGATWVVSTAPVNVTAVGETHDAPRAPRLSAFPNPARAGVTIALETTSRQASTVSVYDLGGRRVADLWSGALSAGGRLELRWDGRGRDGRAVANGMYLIRAESASAHLVTRLLMLR